MPQNSKSLIWSLSTIFSVFSSNLFIMLFALFVCIEQNIRTNGQHLNWDFIIALTIFFFQNHSRSLWNVPELSSLAKLSYIIFTRLLKLRLLPKILLKIVSSPLFSISVLLKTCLVICIITKTHKMLFILVLYQIVFVKPFCGYLKVSP